MLVSERMHFCCTNSTLCTSWPARYFYQRRNAAAVSNVSPRVSGALQTQIPCFACRFLPRLIREDGDPCECVRDSFVHKCVRATQCYWGSAVAFWCATLVLHWGYTSATLRSLQCRILTPTLRTVERALRDLLSSTGWHIITPVACRGLCGLLFRDISSRSGFLLSSADA